MANNIYKTLGANAQTLTILATVCLEDPVTQEKAKTLLDKALAQRPDYTKAVVKKAELLSMYICHIEPFKGSPATACACFCLLQMSLAAKAVTWFSEMKISSVACRAEQ